MTTLSPPAPTDAPELLRSRADDVDKTRSVTRSSARRTISFERWLRYLAMGGLTLLIFLVPWEDQIWQPGEARLSRFAGFGAAVLCGPALFFHGRRHKFLDVHYLALLYGFAVALSTRWSPAEDATAHAFTTFQVIVMMWLIWEFVDTKRKVQLAMFAWICGAFVNVVAVSYQFLVIKEPTDGLFDRYTGGEFADPNDVASIIAVTIPMVWYLANTLKNPLIRLGLLAYIPPAIFGTVITGSRGGFFILAVSLIVLPLTIGALRVPLRVVIVALIGVGAVLAPGLLPEEQLSRALNEEEVILRGPNTDPTSGRGELFSEALNGFAKNWQKGVGADASENYLLENTRFTAGFGAHNTPANIALQTGLLGLVPFTLMIVAIGWRTLKGALFQRRIAIGLFLATFAMMMPAHIEATKRLWILFGLILCVATHAAVDGRKQRN